MLEWMRGDSRTKMKEKETHQSSYINRFQCTIMALPSTSWSLLCCRCIHSTHRTNNKKKWSGRPKWLYAKKKTPQHDRESQRCNESKTLSYKQLFHTHAGRIHTHATTRKNGETGIWNPNVRSSLDRRGGKGRGGSAKEHESTLHPKTKFNALRSAARTEFRLFCKA